MAATLPSIMSEGAITSAPGLRLHHRLLAQHLQRFVVDHVTALDQPVVAVAVVGVEGDIAQDPNIRMGRLYGAHRLAHQVLRVQGLAGVRGLERIVGIGKDGNHRYSQFLGLADGIGNSVDRQPVDPRHGGHGLTYARTVGDKERPYQIVGAQGVFRHQPARPGVAPVAAHARLGKGAAANKIDPFHGVPTTLGGERSRSRISPTPLMPIALFDDHREHHWPVADIVDVYVNVNYAWKACLLRSMECVWTMVRPPADKPRRVYRARRRRSCNPRKKGS